jgi:hypothetical protein
MVFDLAGQSLSGASFTKLKQLQEHIDAYVNAYNDKAEPFVWTKKKVRQLRFKRPPYHSALIPGSIRSKLGDHAESSIQRQKRIRHAAAVVSRPSRARMDRFASPPFRRHRAADLWASP